MSNQSYEVAAAALLGAIQNIRDAVLANGWQTQTIMTVLGEMLAVSPVVQAYIELPASERDEFLAEIFDAAIGNESTALVNQVGPLQGQALEDVSDALKGAFLAYVNRRAG
jgi:hypothetical protein